MCVYISSLIQSAYFLSLFALVSLLSKQLNAFKAYVLLQHVFFLGVTLTGTRQFIDKTTHRHGFWRQFIDTIEDNPSTLFEDNSSTHYYLAIIPKLIK